MNHNDDDQIPWTTARCNRLLRPISSRLAALRKNIESAKSQRKQTARAQAKEVDPEAQEGSATFRKSWKKGDGANDPEWIPEAKPRKTFKKYSASRVHREVHQPKKEPPLGPPGQIIVPTPFIARTLRYAEQSPQYGSPEHAHTPSRRARKPLYFQPKDRLQTLKKETSSDAYGYINGAYSGFENVLEATAQYAPKKEQKGTRSLMSTCLRQIPAHIELREYWQEEEESEDEDISAEIYGQLEQRATRDSNARHGLGEVVRAHAIKMICEAMAERLLPQSLLPSLADLCKRTQSWDVGQELFSVCLMTLQSPLIAPLHPLDDIYESPSHSVLKVFRDYVEHSRSWTMFYQQLSFLLRANKLPVEWLATRSLLPVWTRIIKSINEHDSSFGPARELLQGLFLHGCGIKTGGSYATEEHDLVTTYKAKPQTIIVRPSVRCALSNTIDSLLTIFSCASRSTVAFHDNTTVRLSNNFVRILEDLGQSLLLEAHCEPHQHISGETPAVQTTFIQRACGLIVSTLITRSNQLQHPSNTSSIALSIKALRRLASSSSVKRASIFDTTSELIVSVSQSYSRVTGENNFEVLQEILAFTGSSTEHLAAHYTQFLNEIAYEAALKYSETTQDQEHFHYAKSLGRDLRTLTGSSPEPSDSSSHEADEEVGIMNGYRWEEGIEEWILRTPALPRKTVKDKLMTVREVGNDSSRSQSKLVGGNNSGCEDSSSASSKRLSRSSRTETPPTPTQSSSPSHETSRIAPPRLRDHKSPAVVIYRTLMPTIDQPTPSLKPTGALSLSFAIRRSTSSSPSSDGSTNTSQDSCTSYTDSDDMVDDGTPAKINRKRNFVLGARERYPKRQKNSSLSQQSSGRGVGNGESEDESDRLVNKTRMSSRLKSGASSQRDSSCLRRTLRSHVPRAINHPRDLSMSTQLNDHDHEYMSDEEDELVQCAKSSHIPSTTKRRAVPMCPAGVARRKLRTRSSCMLDHSSGDELSFG